MVYDKLQFVNIGKYCCVSSVGSETYKYSSTDTYIYPYIYIFRLDRLLTRSINHLLVVVPTLSISVRHELSSSILTYISILVRHELSSYLLTHIYRYIVPSRKSHVTGSPGSPPSSVCFELVAIVKLTSQFRDKSVFFRVFRDSGLKII